jgi:hypothetical protein
MLIIYLYRVNKNKNHIYDNIRKRFMKESNKVEDLLKLAEN